jgi:hypothetical protein
MPSKTLNIHTNIRKIYPDLTILTNLRVITPGGSCHYEAVKEKNTQSLQSALQRHNSPKHQVTFLITLQIHGLTSTRIYEFIISLHGYDI